MSTCKRLLALTSCTSLLLTAASASAQAEDPATARAPFEEGRRLVKAGQLDQACPKLEAAGKLYPGSGVFLNLADCYEREGRLASAWAEFGEAWDTPIPVDPASHAFTAEAPGHSPWTSQVHVNEPGRTITIAIPELTAQVAALVAPVPPVPAEPAPPAGAPKYWTGRRTVGAVAAGVGVVGLGVGGILGLLAKSEYNTAAGEAGPARVTDSTSALHSGDAATVVFTAGAVVAAAGLVVWLTAPNASASVGTTGRDLMVFGRF